MKQAWTYLFIVVLILAVFARFYRIDRVPVSLSWDELAIAVDAKTIRSTGADMHGSFWFSPMFASWGDFKLPVYIWLSSIVAFFTSNNYLVARLPSAILGVCNIVLLMALAQKMLSFTDRKTKNYLNGNLLKLMAALTIGFSPWAILFSRTGFEAYAGQFFTTLSIFIVVAWNKKRWSSFASALLGAIGVYTYFSTRFVWPIVFVFVQIIPLLELKSIKNSIKTSLFTILLPIAFFALLLLPLFFSPLYKPSQTFRLSTPSLISGDIIANEVSRLTVTGANPLTSKFLYSHKSVLAQRIFQSISLHLTPDFLFFSGDQNQRHGTQRHGLFLLLFLPFLLIGIYSLWYKNKKMLAILSLWWFVAIIPAAIPLEVPHALRSLNALTPSVLIIAVGLTELVSWLQSQKKTISYGVMTIMIIAFCVSLAEFYMDYFKTYPVRSADAWGDGYEQLAQTAIDLRHTIGDNTPIIVVMPEGRTYLWFMALGNYSEAEFATWRSDQYQFKSFDNIFFVSNLETTLHSSESNTLITVTMEDVSDKILQGEYTKLNSLAVFSASNSHVGVVSLIETSKK